VFKGSIEQIHALQKLGEMPGHPVHSVEAENRALEEFISASVKPHVVALRAGETGAAEALKEVFEALGQIDAHYVKKEMLLFPYMEKYGISGPPKVMWGVDDEIRRLIKEQRDILNAPEGGQRQIAEFDPEAEEDAYIPNDNEDEGTTKAQPIQIPPAGPQPMAGAAQQEDGPSAKAPHAPADNTQARVVDVIPNRPINPQPTTDTDSMVIDIVECTDAHDAAYFKIYIKKNGRVVDPAGPGTAMPARGKPHRVAVGSEALREPLGQSGCAGIRVGFGAEAPVTSPA
jgi:hypothetical protein